jgi:hypothetical protein
MNEILKKLLESELLSDDSKQELADAFQAQLNEAIEEAKATAAAETKVELHEQFALQKEQLVEAVDRTVNEFIVAEFATLKDDIKAFRDLEAEKTIEIAKEKTKLSQTLKEDMATLVQQLDKFLEERIVSEFQDMRDDLVKAKEADFGREVFESFLPVYRKYFVNPTKTEAELSEAKVKLGKLNKKYKNIKQEKDSLYRKIRVESVLAPLTGTNRDLMGSILSSVATEKLEEAYKQYLPRVLKESVDPAKEVITENAHGKLGDEHLVSKTIDINNAFVVSGDTAGRIDESVEPVDSLASQFQRLAGITKPF